MKKKYGMTFEEGENYENEVNHPLYRQSVDSFFSQFCQKFTPLINNAETSQNMTIKAGNPSYTQTLSKSSRNNLTI